MAFDILATVTYQSVSGKVGYHQRFATDMTIEVVQTAHAGYPQNNWFPYLTLADCEALCQASPTCVTATYEFDKDRISLETFPTYHGTCSLNSGTPTVILRQNMHEPTRMTIIKRDSGMFD